MRGGTPRGELLSPIGISAASVQRGDLIQVGGQHCRVADIFQLPNGVKRLVFDSGESLTLHTQTRLIAMRLLKVRR